MLHLGDQRSTMSRLKTVDVPYPSALFDQCMSVRMAVFVVEQGYSAEEEADGLDSAHRHLLCIVEADEDPVGLLS